LIVTNLAGKVLESFFNNLGVQNFLNFPLRFVFAYNWWWKRLDLARKRVGRGRLKKRYVEDRVNLLGCKKVELISVGGNLLDDSKFSKTFVMELGRGSIGLHMSVQ